jgi:hypothetical protein
MTGEAPSPLEGNRTPREELVLQHERGLVQLDEPHPSVAIMGLHGS